MKKLLTLLLVVGMLISAGGCKEEIVETKRQKHAQKIQQRFQGGNLHKATIRQWKNATYQNKRSTVGDWLAATLWKGHLNLLEDFDQLNIKVQLLVKGMDIVVADIPVRSEMEKEKVAAVAVLLIRLAPEDLGPDS